ncbi:MAG: calcium/proton exchanger [Ardenticatenia bacterium]|nr:calcium/proton exchanger [Ardenticatenia bacterium]
MSVVRAVLHPVYAMLVFTVLALLAEFTGANEVVIFALSVLGIVPLAKLIGDATEELAVHTGPRIGGLLNATLGNAAELIITVVAIRAGLLELVKASITGSILGNLLLIMGGAIVLGGLKHGVQRFDRTHAGLAASQMTLAIIALAIPSLFAQAIEPDHEAVQWLSVGVAIIMLAVYALNLLYSLHPASSSAQAHGTGEGDAERARWSVRTALVVLALATALIAWLSEILVGVVEHTVSTLGISEFFIGIIIIPLVGNAAEHVVAITVARENQMELSMSISLGSSTQIALLVAPLLVLLSLVLGPEPLVLSFTPSS